MGISLDENLKPLQEMVTSKGISWPQAWDADEKLRKLFNVNGTPFTTCSIETERLRPKTFHFKKLSGAIGDLLKKPRARGEEQRAKRKRLSAFINVL